MAHIRKQIRDRLETILTSGVTLAQRRVFGSRIYPLTAP
jgi:phage baseplate assembly protein W